MKGEGFKVVSLQERPIFVAGYERSGTTMLMYMIGSHPRIAVPEVTWYYPRFRPYLYTYGDLRDEASFRTLVGEMIFGLNYPFFGRKVNPRTIVDEIISYAKERTFAGAFGAVLEWYASGDGKPRWGEKCPANVFHIRSIREDFPNAQFIYVTRDGRDSGAEYLQSSFGPTNVFCAAELWKTFVNAAKRWRSELDRTEWLDVRYETLVRQPEKTLREVCEFLGEEYTPEMLEFYKAPYAQRRAKMSDHAPIGSPVTDKLIGIYRELLSLREQRVFAGVAGRELSENDYEVDVEPLEVSEEDAVRYRELDGRIRAATSELLVNRAYYDYNDWLIDQWEERRRKGIWKDSDRPQSTDPNEEEVMRSLAEIKRWKDRFCIKRKYAV